MSKVLILGAGKIGRGFIGHLFHHSGYELYFFDVSVGVVRLLNKEKKYRIDIAAVGKDKTEYVDVEKSFSPEDKDGLLAVLNEVEIMACSVGANNIEATATFLKPLLQKRDNTKRLNWLICENANKPAEKIMGVLKENLSDDAFADFIENKLGLVETQVLRTGMSADSNILADEPLALRMHNWWTLPLDKDAFIGEIPDVKGFQPRTNFGNELLRKIYTFNGLNGPISYVGWQNGYSILHEAALAPEMQDFLKQIMEESAFGLINEFGFDEAEHLAFQKLAFDKYRDPAVNDTIPRNARDCKRKVTANERLVGPALLCLKHGKVPVAYAKAIAAAYAYKNVYDEATCELQETLGKHGISHVLKHHSGIDEGNPLHNLVIEAFQDKSYLFK